MDFDLIYLGIAAVVIGVVFFYTRKQSKDEKSKEEAQRNGGPGEE